MFLYVWIAKIDEWMDGEEDTRRSGWIWLLKEDYAAFVNAEMPEPGPGPELSLCRHRIFPRAVSSQTSCPACVYQDWMQ